LEEEQEEEEEQVEGEVLYKSMSFFTFSTSPFLTNSNKRGDLLVP